MPDPKPNLAAGPPPIPADLVAWLEAVYPDRIPSRVLKDMTPDRAYGEICRYDGQLDVIRTLRIHLDIQTKRSPRSNAQLTEVP